MGHFHENENVLRNLFETSHDQTTTFWLRKVSKC